uniref:Uncharacterized protein n=1 Tax=Oryza barthii TaxID=65489 RepID=A0A0D3GYH8_9ORYZ
MVELNSAVTDVLSCAYAVLLSSLGRSWSRGIGHSFDEVAMTSVMAALTSGEQQRKAVDSQSTSQNNGE